MSFIYSTLFLAPLPRSDIILSISFWVLMSTVPELSLRTESLPARCRGLPVSHGLSLTFVMHLHLSVYPLRILLFVLFFYFFAGVRWFCFDFKPSTPGLVSHCSYHDIHVANVLDGLEKNKPLLPITLWVLDLNYKLQIALNLKRYNARSI